MTEFLWRNILLITIFVIVILVIFLIVTKTLRVPEQPNVLSPTL